MWARPFITSESPLQDETQTHEPPLKGPQKVLSDTRPGNWCPRTLNPTQLLESLLMYTSNLKTWSMNLPEQSAQSSAQWKDLSNWLALSSPDNPLTDRIFHSSACCFGIRSTRMSKINSTMYVASLDSSGSRGIGHYLGWWLVNPHNQPNLQNRTSSPHSQRPTSGMSTQWVLHEGLPSTPPPPLQLSYSLHRHYLFPRSWGSIHLHSMLSP